AAAIGSPSLRRVCLKKPTRARKLLFYITWPSINSRSTPECRLKASADGSSLPPTSSHGRSRRVGFLYRRSSASAERERLSACAWLGPYQTRPCLRRSSPCRVLFRLAARDRRRWRGESSKSWSGKDRRVTTASS